ncbi:MAG: hypothetical protein S4CHLAM45_08810 [Chlamydiales bacterium]|nr:hypothetical protein [Chlamydiales bacterium]MCH9620369.1 hypothetical protein [Chlamydiales bacterium]MCH9622985.1 hypothetical protein [Chlamydiales bacterium]
MLTDLEFIKTVFEVNYAPLDWKRSYAGFNLESSFSKAKAKVAKNKQPTTKEFQQVLRNLFNEPCDYHVGVSFFSTESASLPFLIKGAEGRYFICYIDRTALPRENFPFEVGDELITFDRKPIDQVIQNLLVEELGKGNTLETNQALAELLLTQREGCRGSNVPSGPVSMTFKRRGEANAIKIELEWDYTPERITDFSKMNRSNPKALFSRVKQRPCVEPKVDGKELFSKMMVYPHWNRSYVGHSFDLDNRHYIGSRKSYLPPLGKKIWQSGHEDYFDAYIFKTTSGRSIGYLRIAHYLGDEEEIEEFCECIARLQRSTDALVIDQLNNPGGSVFYLYALIAALTDRPLYTPKHHIALTQEEVYVAATFLPELEDVTTIEEAKELIGETLGGYPVSLETVRLMKGFCQFVLAEWSCGELCTKPTYIFGVDEIEAHPKAHYTKPILVLTNSLDFSGGDFFPAILQDNKRAVIFGTRTAGAGGYVMQASYPNQNGVSEFHLTASLAERINFEPIENLGVTPDIEYKLTADDLQYNYRNYVENIVKTVESLIPTS